MTPDHYAYNEFYEMIESESRRYIEPNNVETKIEGDVVYFLRKDTGEEIISISRRLSESMSFNEFRKIINLVNQAYREGFDAGKESVKTKIKVTLNI
jgi:hypothetical protein